MRCLATLGCLLLSAAGTMSTPPPVQDKKPPAVVELLEDDTAGLIARLVNDGGLDATRADRDLRDFYSGVCSVRITPFQRFSSRIAGWNYRIAEKPGPGEYRHLRFAWKRVGSAGIMIQLHNTAGSWNQRYVAGQSMPSTAGWGARLTVTDKLPTEWTVVTRDLFKDFGAMTITGLALTPMEGGSYGLFDHFYLGRTIEDLDRASDTVFGRMPLNRPLPPEELARLWHDLASEDVKSAGAALRTLTAGSKQSVDYLARKLRQGLPTVEEGRVRKLIAALDDNAFRVREAAFAELDRLGEAALPLLRKAAAEPASPELLRRVEELIRRHTPSEQRPTPARARLLRAVRVLEWAGTAEARQALERLAAEPRAGGVTEDARQALARLRGK